MSYLEVKDLYAGYARGMNVLQGISFSLEQDSKIALIGANGGGKSTLLKTISGVVQVRSGSILFRGEEIKNKNPHEIVEMGIVQVPEEGGTFPSLTVEENLDISCTRKSAKKKAASNKEMIYGLFPILKEKAKLAAGSLSGGQRKMLSIGKAIMADPQLLLLDDISMGLAPKVVEELYETLGELVKQLDKPVLVVEQIMEIALRFAEYGHVVQQGRIVLSGPSEELLDSEAVRQSYIGA